MGVILVYEEFSTRETWPMECLHCWHVWLEEYVARHLTDGHGHDVVVWLRAGAIVQPPWSGATCPDCGHSRVTAFPPGSRSYRLAAAGRAAPPADTRFGTAKLGTATAVRTARAPAATPAPGWKIMKEVGKETGARTMPYAAAKAARRSAFGRRWQPVLLYALLGSAFLLLTGFTLVEYIYLAVNH